MKIWASETTISVCLILRFWLNISLCAFWSIGVLFKLGFSSCLSVIKKKTSSTAVATFSLARTLSFFCYFLSAYFSNYQTAHWSALSTRTKRGATTICGWPSLSPHPLLELHQLQQRRCSQQVSCIFSPHAHTYYWLIQWCARSVLVMKLKSHCRSESELKLTLRLFDIILLFRQETCLWSLETFFAGSMWNRIEGFKSESSCRKVASVCWE